MYPKSQAQNLPKAPDFYFSFRYCPSVRLSRTLPITKVWDDSNLTYRTQRFVCETLHMRCLIAEKLIITLKERIRTIKMADADMRNAELPWRSRKDDWDTSVMRLAAVRTELEDHKLICQMCGGIEAGWLHSAIETDAFRA